ncbi:RloB family protein [Emticicia sp. W12TSBA100-4]|uniref:RloB family protein n=1 Tax=Emticicia sp. W12TSBA100-4 TaxID=3160965 RepID=UPI0033066E73
MSRNRARISRQIQPPRQILILTEGETEEIYLKSYKSDDENRRRLSGVGIEIYKPKDHSPLGLLAEAKKRIKEAKKDKMPYEKVWIVFDRDGHANIPATFHEKQAVNEIEIAFSVVCFEYWVLLHFEKTTRLFNDCDSIGSYIRQKHFPEYEKSRNNYHNLKDKISLAIENATWTTKQNQNDLNDGLKPYQLQAYTNVHELISFLKDLK